jgi:hypothetical protein
VYPRLINARDHFIHSLNTQFSWQTLFWCLNHSWVPMWVLLKLVAQARISSKFHQCQASESGILAVEDIRLPDDLFGEPAPFTRSVSDSESDWVSAGQRPDFWQATVLKPLLLIRPLGSRFAVQFLAWILQYIYCVNKNKNKNKTLISQEFKFIYCNLQR